MAYAANAMIISTVKEELKDTLTAGDMERVVDVVGNILTNYEITPNAVEAMENDTLLNVFLDAMNVEGRSAKTIERYKYIISRFLTETKVPTGSVTQYHIRQYLASEKERGISDSTIRGYCWVFGAYFGWLHRDGIIRRNPMSNIGHIRVQKKVREVFCEVDIERMKTACESIRDKAIICFLKATGCRISEVTQLNRDDIDFENLECVVLGKGNKQRTVYIDSVTGMILKTYLCKRKDDSLALFVGKGTERIQPSGVRAMLKRIERKTGVQHIHPHKFRSTQLTELANRGMPIEQIKILAGHEKIDTTMGYVKVDQQNVKHSYRKYA